MNTISYTNLAKMCAFVEERALTRQSDRTAQLRREADAAGNTQSSAAQADLLALLVRLTHSSSVIAIGTGAVIESERIVDALGGRGQLTAVDSSPEGIAAVRRLFNTLDEDTQTTLRAVNASADVFLERLNAGAYQLIVVSGDPANYAPAFAQAPRLLDDGGMIVFTDVMAMEGTDTNGGMLNPADRSAKAVAMRELLDTVESDERFDATLTPVGTGMLLALRR